MLVSAGNQASTSPPQRTPSTRPPPQKQHKLVLILQFLLVCREVLDFNANQEFYAFSNLQKLSLQIEKQVESKKRIKG